MAQTVADKVAFWELEPDDAAQTSVVPQLVEPCIRSSGMTDIGIFPEEKDVRVRVDKADLQPGGKYYSIVKLFIQYQASDTWTTATGWLVRDDLLVTAAHCVLDGDNHATRIRVHAGYSAGSENTRTSFGDQRSVARIALPSAWTEAKAEKSDIAFLQLDMPYQDVTPIKYSTTDKEAQQLTIIGYPTDLGAKTGTPGGEMYYMGSRREVDLEPNKWNMMVYRGDTQGGLSGAPIMRDDDFVAIGVHVRGGSFNYGVVIGGQDGVNFDVYEKALGILKQGSVSHDVLKVATDTNREWLNYMHIF
ncbi:ATP synthase F1 [Xylaria telfairii]|nr:ATP synthase F1 [Xylaria telfairii]